MYVCKRGGENRREGGVKGDKERKKGQKERGKDKEDSFFSLYAFTFTNIYN